MPDGFRPDYVLSVNLLDHTYDVYEVFARLREIRHRGHADRCHEQQPAVGAGASARPAASALRSRESPRNFITNRDIASILSVLGFHVVEASLALPVPERVPVIGPLLNAALPDLPLLRYTCSTQYLAARPRIAREQLSVSVVVPCHNEEGNIPECARRVPDMGAGTEIIFVDDGSRDGTRDRGTGGDGARSARSPRSRYETNYGKANAVRAGFAAARNDVLMILDADMSVAPEDLPKFLVPIQAGNAEFVNGTRLIYPIEGKAMPTVNFVGNKAFCLLVSWVLRQRVSDTLCGTKVLLRRDYEAMPLADASGGGISTFCSAPRG